MKLIAFSKQFKGKSPQELAAIAHKTGLDGWDLCVRPGYPVNPDNVAAELPNAARLMRDSGLCIPMVTGDFGLLTPDHPTARPIMAAMDKADIRFLKLGYFPFDPLKHDYWREVDRIRHALDGWQQFARQNNIRVCYHTHSHHCMGGNCGAMMHLLGGFDPRYIGVYVDPAHLLVEGEEFAVGLEIVREHLSLVALKDVAVIREESNGHGRTKFIWPPAGEGMVDWTTVFGDLARVGFDGPMTVHCEFLQPEAPKFMEKATKEVAFFKTMAANSWPLKR